MPLGKQGLSAGFPAQAAVGFEPTNNGFAIRPPSDVTASPDNDLRETTESCCTKSSANSGDSQAESYPADRDLATINAVWPELAQADKVAIMAMIRAAATRTSDGER